jgi:serine phosphatase RsbU (regulator of sigma subunit)
VEAGKRNFVTYNALQPGSYVFEVDATNANVKSLYICILPAWWQTLSFKILVGVLVVVWFIYFIRMRESRLKRAKQLLEQRVERRTAQLSEQKGKIEIQQKQLTDNIWYAEKIQRAILPVEDQINSVFSEHFILFKPRDIVSGDFYYFRKIGKKMVFAVADCTGHGVSGAIMSIMANSFLNETLSHRYSLKPNKILDDIRERIKTTLHQAGKYHETQDGMDIALCILDPDTLIMQYAGAYLPVYIIRKKKLIVFKGDRQPVSIYLKEIPFTYHEIQLEKEDVIYLLSDGYASQLGGKYRKRFLTYNLKQLLLKINKRPLKEQRKILNDTIENWRGENEQMDDICIIGLKL